MDLAMAEACTEAACMEEEACTVEVHMVVWVVWEAWAAWVACTAAWEAPWAVPMDRV